jgi:hypothetical protein
MSKEIKEEGHKKEKPLKVDMDFNELLEKTTKFNYKQYKEDKKRKG